MNEEIQRIFQIIEDKNMTQAKFSDAIGVSPGSISHLKKRSKKASSYVIKKIIERFDDINPEWLLTGKGTKNLTASVKRTDLFNMPADSDRQTDTVSTTDQTVYRPDGNRNIIEKEVIIYKDKPLKTIEKLVIFFSDNTYETFVPGK